MRSNFVKRFPLRTKRRRRAGDGFRATVLMVALIGMLASMFVLVTEWRASMIAASRVKALAEQAAMEQQIAEQKANRIGSILFVTPKKMCEEIRFDKSRRRSCRSVTSTVKPGSIKRPRTKRARRNEAGVSAA